MTREELREYCERQIQRFERVEKIMPVTTNDWKRYEEHKLILELLEQEPRWIPCSEILPEEAIKVLVQAEDLYYMNGGKGIVIGWLNGRYWSTYTVNGIELIRYPVAWMPLPKAYRGVEE